MSRTYSHKPFKFRLIENMKKGAVDHDHRFHNDGGDSFEAPLPRKAYVRNPYSPKRNPLVETFVAKGNTALEAEIMDLIELHEPYAEELGFEVKLVRIPAYRLRNNVFVTETDEPYFDLPHYHYPSTTGLSIYTPLRFKEVAQEGMVYHVYYLRKDVPVRGAYYGYRGAYYGYRGPRYASQYCTDFEHYNMHNNTDTRDGLPVSCSPSFTDSQGNFLHYSSGEQYPDYYSRASVRMANKRAALAYNSGEMDEGFDDAVLYQNKPRMIWD